VLGEQGFSVNHMDLLSWCCETYGPESVEGSTFRFIQVVESDGSSRFVSAKEFRGVVSNLSSIFFALKLVPNALLKDWQSRFVECPGSTLAICFSAGAKGLKYLAHGKTEAGCLDKLWSDYGEAPLFSLFISVLEGTWGVERGVLASQEGWVHRANELSGFFRRE
jgi:hypothetical protein